MEPAHLPNELFDLIAEKAYAALTEEERLLIAPHLSAHEYDEMHLLVASVQEVDEQILTPRQRPQVLPQRKWFLRVLYHPVPLYQAAAVVALLIGGYWLWAAPLPHDDASTTLPYVRTGTSIEQDSYPDSLVFQL